MTNTGQVAGNVLKALCQFVSPIKKKKKKKHPELSLSILSLRLALSRRFQRELQHLAAAEQTSKTTLYAVFIVKPVFCHCLPSLLSSISLSSSLCLSPSLKMNLPACAHALHHCQVPHGGPPPLSQTGHQPLAGIIPHLQNSPHCF